jgi:hypothetical protein
MGGMMTIREGTKTLLEGLAVIVGKLGMNGMLCAAPVSSSTRGEHERSGGALVLWQ